MSIIRQVHGTCPGCGADDAAPRFAATVGGCSFDADTLRCTSTGLGRHGPIVQCRRCATVYSDPQPEPTALLAAYRLVEDPTYVAHSIGRERTFGALLAELHQLERPPGALLDVGCYTGVFMAVAAAAGWQVAGLELSRWAAALARAASGCEVHECGLDEVPIAAGSLGVVTMWDVIEHVPRPAALLQRVADLLRPGGVLGLSSHFLDTTLARVMGTRYPFLMEMHLTHFTVPTLARLLAGTGFELAMVRPHRRFVTWAYLLGRIGGVVSPLAPLLGRLARLSWLERRTLVVRGAGLRNVWARRV